MVARVAHTINTLFVVIMLAGMLPVSCMVHCALTDAQHQHTSHFYVCDLGHGTLSETPLTDIHSTGRLTAVLDALMPLLTGMLVAFFVYLHGTMRPTYRQWCETPPYPPPRLSAQ
jgi:hypothetical protein